MTNLIQPTRRGLITGLVSLIAAPALVRASSIMPVKTIPVKLLDYFEDYIKGDPPLVADYTPYYFKTLQHLKDTVIPTVSEGGPLELLIGGVENEGDTLPFKLVRVRTEEERTW